MPAETAKSRLIRFYAAASAILLATSAARAQCEVQVLNAHGRVAVCGDVAIVGSSSQGTVYVYRHDGTQWVQEAKLTSPDPDPDEGFADASAISGDLIVVGAPYAYIPGVQSGAVYIYRYDPQKSQWVYEATLTASGFESAYLFGWSVSIDGGAALVGARQAEIDGMFQVGSAYVFRYNGSEWVEEAKLTDPQGEAMDLFGQAVSIKGDVALIGAHGNDQIHGAAFVFRYNPHPPGKWLLETELTSSDPEGQDWFGFSVSLSDAVAIIGAYQDNSTPKGNDAGSAYIFRYDGVGWIEEQKITASDGAPLDWFGWSVSMSTAGNRTLVGSPKDDDLGSQSGSAYIFRYTEGVWKEVIKLTASDGAPFQKFGHTVSVTQDTALITGGGKTYVFAGMGGLDCNDNGEPDACDIFDGTSEDGNGNGVPDECDADLNGDGVVGILDLLMLLAGWGPCGPPCPPACLADLDGNCTVNVLDLLILLANWG